MSKRAAAPPATQKPTRKRVVVPRTGMPAPDSVREVVEFISPGRRKYRVLKTTETDAYDGVPGQVRKKPKR
jgi:hypothetical protein